MYEIKMISGKTISTSWVSKKDYKKIQSLIDKGNDGVFELESGGGINLSHIGTITEYKFTVGI